MKDYPYPSYLRTNRKRWALTREQLGFLLGIAAPSAVSRYEHLVRTPPAHVIIASEFIFGEHARQIFPGLYGSIERNVMGRAAIVAEQIGQRDDKTAKTIGELLDNIAARAASDASHV
jgi:hypothetical protein